eukprot:3128472-Pyramimonas_sp.AAC.1
MEAAKDVSMEEAPGQAPVFNGICSSCYSAAGKSSRTLCRVKRKHTTAGCALTSSCAKRSYGPILARLEVFFVEVFFRWPDCGPVG